MKKILSVFAVCMGLQAAAQTPCVDGMADIYPCQNVDLLAYMPLADIGGGANTNDLWGWVSPETGKEYALVGCSNGTAFIDITTPTAPIYLGLLPTHTSVNLWRDIETFNNYCFIGSEAPGHGLQIFDLMQLDDVTNPPLVFEETAFYGEFGNSHTINIDTASGYCYAMGTNTFSGGLHIVDINDPLNPSLAGGFAEDGYTHDGFALTYNGPDQDYAGDEIMIACNADALTIVNCTDKSDCQMISTTDYAELGYVHQGWFTKDFRYFILDDELDEQDFNVGTRTHLFDLNDLDNPVYMGVYQHDNTSIDHNMYIVDQFIYQSNYRSGVRIFDASRAAQGTIDPLGYFDLFPLNDLRVFSGTWSNYPFLPSGVNIATSMYDGFFIMQPTLVMLPEQPMLLCPDASMTFEITINADLQFPLTVGFDNAPAGATWSAPTISGPGTYSITLMNGWEGTNESILTLNTTFGTQYEFAISTDVCVGVYDLTASTSSIQLYPNPASHQISFNKPGAHAIYEICDMTGKVVLHGRTDRRGAAQVMIDTLTPGMYCLKVGSSSERFVVQR